MEREKRTFNFVYTMKKPVLSGAHTKLKLQSIRPLIFPFQPSLLFLGLPDEI